MESTNIRETGLKAKSMAPESKEILLRRNNIMVNILKTKDKVKENLQDKMGIYMRETGKAIFPKDLVSKSLQTETNIKEHLKMDLDMAMVL